MATGGGRRRRGRRGKNNKRADRERGERRRERKLVRMKVRGEFPIVKYVFENNFDVFRP